MTLGDEIRQLLRRPGEIQPEAAAAAIALADALPPDGKPHAVLLDEAEITFEWTSPDNTHRVSYHYDESPEPTITRLRREGDTIVGWST